ncbi:MAG: glucoamylase family protein [Ottowia sp.]|nr:hypothetical protein [Ottowia sp.]
MSEHRDPPLPPVVEGVQHDAFHYFPAHTNPANGLVRDSTQEHSPCSIAAVGFALTCWPIAVRRGWMSRADALQRALAALRFFAGADLSGTPRASGYRGFFYHFLDMETGQRAWNSELSTIDTALLVAGMLLAAQYFDGDDADEVQLRRLAQAIHERVDWRWAQNGGAALSLGWTPEQGFLRWRWIGYSEALILYVLALGSPSHAASRDAYEQWLSGYRWKRIYGMDYVYAGPLFIHQFSHLWIDFRGIADAYMRARGIDYFENSRRATLVQREYAIRNPRGWEGYCGECWGLTASNGPGPEYGRLVRGRKRDFYGYTARGAPFGPDDGTVSPWASIASLPFAPDVVLPTIESLSRRAGGQHAFFGFYSSFNPSYHDRDGDAGWICPWHIGLNQGPIVAMIENHRCGFLWQLMRGCQPVVDGLLAAGFRGGWLGG